MQIPNLLIPKMLEEQRDDFILSLILLMLYNDECTRKAPDSLKLSLSTFLSPTICHAPFWFFRYQETDLTPFDDPSRLICETPHDQRRAAFQALDQGIKTAVTQLFIKYLQPQYWYRWMLKLEQTTRLGRLIIGITGPNM